MSALSRYQRCNVQDLRLRVLRLLSLAVRVLHSLLNRYDQRAALIVPLQSNRRTFLELAHPMLFKAQCSTPKMVDSDAAPRSNYLT